MTPKQSVITTFAVYSVTYIWIYVQFWIESGFESFGGNNMVRGFVYIPLIALPMALIFKMKWSRMCDFVAPCVCISFGVSHIGCVFVGCCHGCESSFGIYHPYYGTTVFPVQLFEAATALLIVFLVVYRARRKGFVSDGRSFPLMLIMYGSTRFLWEFLRDNEKILWRFSSLAFHALFMALVGACALICLLHKNEHTPSVKTKFKSGGNKNAHPMH